MPDRMRGDEPRTVIWDDEAGIVAGDHSDVAHIRELFDAPKPVTIGGPWGMWDLVDPAHDPVEFLTLLADEYWPHPRSTPPRNLARRFRWAGRSGPE